MQSITIDRLRFIAGHLTQLDTYRPETTKCISRSGTSWSVDLCANGYFSESGWTWPRGFGIYFWRGDDDRFSIAIAMSGDFGTRHAFMTRTFIRGLLFFLTACGKQAFSHHDN